MARPARAAPVVERIEVQVALGSRRFAENVYLAYDRVTRDAVIIDPGTPDPRVQARVRAGKLRVRGILNTHGHPDHIGGNGFYRGLYRVPIWAHAEDARLYERSLESRPTRLLRAETRLALPGLDVRVLPTPGHTAGSVCYLLGALLFSGDTLFRGGIGRTWGSPTERRQRTAQEIRAIRQRLLVLPDDTRVLPGHGLETTIGRERTDNPWISDRQPG